MTAFTTRYRTATVRGHEIFYRSAGDPANPTVVLLHGFPASSFMYRELIAELSDSYHLIAPDHLGFGRSATPSVEEFEYTFDALTAITSELLDQLGLDRFALYMQDYGAPIGFRIASQQPAPDHRIDQPERQRLPGWHHAVLGAAARLRRGRRDERRAGAGQPRTGRAALGIHARRAGRPAGPGVAGQLDDGPGGARPARQQGDPARAVP